MRFYCPVPYGKARAYGTYGKYLTITHQDYYGSLNRENEPL